MFGSTGSCPVAHKVGLDIVFVSGGRQCGKTPAGVRNLGWVLDHVARCKYELRVSFAQENLTVVRDHGAKEGTYGAKNGYSMGRALRNTCLQNLAQACLQKRRFVDENAGVRTYVSCADGPPQWKRAIHKTGREKRTPDAPPVISRDVHNNH